MRTYEKSVIRFPRSKHRFCDLNMKIMKNAKTMTKKQSFAYLEELDIVSCPSIYQFLEGFKARVLIQQSFWRHERIHRLKPSSFIIHSKLQVPIEFRNYNSVDGPYDPLQGVSQSLLSQLLVPLRCAVPLKKITDGNIGSHTFLYIFRTR